MLHMHNLARLLERLPSKRLHFGERELSKVIKIFGHISES
jgi:hypothetical protein